MVKLRVAVWPSTPPYDPWTKKCFQDLPHKPCPKPGYELEPFLTVMTILGWSYEWVLANESGLILDDGTVTGALGMVHRGEADVSANVLRITEERMQLVDFSTPVQFLEQVYYLTMPNELLIQHFVLRPFELETWLMVFFGMAVFIVVWAACTVLLINKNYSWKNALIHSMHRHLITVGAMESRRNSNRPPFISKCVSISFFALSFIFLGRIYQSVMSGMLAVPLKEKVPFGSTGELVELLRQGTWHLIYPSTPEYLPTCSGQICDELDRALLKNPVSVVPFGSEFYQKINYENHIYFGQQLGEVVKYQFSLNKDKWTLPDRGLIIRDDAVFASPGGYFFPKKSKYRRKFDDTITSIFGGIEQMVRSYDEMKSYPKADLELHTSRVSLSLLHLNEVIVMAIGGYIVCFVIFVVEVLINWHISTAFISPSPLRRSVQNWVMLRQEETSPDHKATTRLKLPDLFRLSERTTKFVVPDP